MAHNEPYDDDLPVGRLLNRREALLALAGAGAAVAIAACAPGSSSTPLGKPQRPLALRPLRAAWQYACLRGAPSADRGAVLRG